MPIVTIPSTTTTIDFLTPDTTYLLPTDETVNVASGGLRLSADNARLLIDGTIELGFIALDGENSTLHIREGAQILESLIFGGADNPFIQNDADISSATAPANIRLVSERNTGATLLNTGNIDTTSFGMELVLSDGVQVINTGTITSARVPILIRESENAVVQNFGIMRGGDEGVDLSGPFAGSDADNTTTFFNAGNVSATNSPRAIEGGEANNVVVNTGTLFGNVSLDRGNDQFNTRQGTVTGTVFGEAGNDTIIGGANAEDLNGGSGEDRVHGGQGADIVSGAGGDDFLFGDAGNDTIRGGGGNDIMEGGFGSDNLLGFGGDDIMNGGAGNDTLTGGLGADVYQFDAIAGDDRIFSWQDGLDLIDLSAYGVTSTLALTSQISNSGGNAVVDLTGLGGSGSITIFGAAGLIDASDFILSDPAPSSSPITLIPGGSTQFIGDTDNAIYQLSSDQTITNPASDGIRDFITLSGFRPSGVTWLIDGTIDTLGGMFIVGTEATIHVGAEGVINSTVSRAISVNQDTSYVRNDGTIDSGFIGIGLRGEGTQGLNTGTITATSDGVQLWTPDSTSFVNTGTVISLTEAGISANSGDGSTAIQNHGTIRGSAEGVDIGATGGTHTLFNTGTILATAGPRAFNGGAGDNIVTNAGAMRGNISLDGGDDVFINRAGTVTGSVFGEGGNDTLMGGTAAEDLNGGSAEDRVYGGLGADIVSGAGGDDNLFGEGGDDLMRGGAGNDYMLGGFGADTLQGFGGDDILNGGAGNDTLIGGVGADVFQFQDGSGTDRIFGWEDGTDEIDITALNVTSALALNAAISNVGGNAVVDLSAVGGSGSIIITGAAGTISEADFIV